jgi:glycosyltransferase involved in cell wall biosynthesis
MLPSTSIVIPSFNQGQYIQRTLLSILKQEYAGDVEIIVSDGGSTDDTPEVLKRYPQVRWWSSPDAGIADATNKALGVARGEILAIQSSDDYYLPHAFTYTIEHLLRHPNLALASGCDVYLQPDGRTFACSRLDDHDLSPRSLMLRRVLPQHCTFFHRRVIDRIGLLDTELPEGAEVDFWYRALHLFEGQFIPRHTAVYQVHPAQRTQTSRRWFASMKRVVERAEAHPEYGAIYRMSDEDRFNAYLRWQIQAAAMSGAESDVRGLLEIVRNDFRVTGETRDALALHGYLPRAPRAIDAPRHPNHAVPVLDWWQQEWRRRAAA